MKESIAENNFDLLKKIEVIEKEVRTLKLTILKKLPSPVKKIVKLKGIIKGVDLTEHEISLAQKSLYGKFVR
jgi:hypothetical protein